MSNIIKLRGHRPWSDLFIEYLCAMVTLGKAADALVRRGYFRDATDPLDVAYDAAVDQLNDVATRWGNIPDGERPVTKERP